MIDETQTDSTAAESTNVSKPAKFRRPVKQGLFRDDSGSPSSMRLMSMIALITSIVFGWVTLNKEYADNATNYNGIYITIGFLLAAFAPKALQKFAEVKVHETDNA